MEHPQDYLDAVDRVCIECSMPMPGDNGYCDVCPVRSTVDGSDDARLIAAAPDLLAACEAASSFLRDCRTHDADRVGYLVRAAIARATGDAS